MSRKNRVLSDSLRLLRADGNIIGETSGAMNINTNITKADWGAFVQHVAKSASKPAGVILQLLFIAVLIGSATGVLVVFLRVQLEPLSLAIGSVVSILWVMIASQTQMRRIGPDENGYLLGEHEVTLSAAGVRYTSSRHESLFTWACVRGVETTQQHVFIMVDKNAAIIVPRRAFASDGERELFLSELQRCLAATPALPKP